MAVSNQLEVSFQYQQINNKFEFYLISTTEKYIPFGAKCLDFKDGKIESLAFENGKSLYIMTKKNIFSKMSLVENLDNDKLYIKQLNAPEIPQYILFRLLLYSLNNYNADNLSFNNLTGKFYMFKPEWMKKNRSSFKAISINVDSSMNILVEAVTFAKYSLFKKNKKINEYPKYVFSNKNFSLKRVFDVSSDEVYIKKGIYNEKAEIPFFSMSKEDFANTKVYYLYYTLNLLKIKFKEMIEFSFKTIDVLKNIGVERDKKFMDYALKEMGSLEVNLVNMTGGSEFEEEYKELTNIICNRLGCSNINKGSNIDRGKANIVLIHNREYYDQFEYTDPYITFNLPTVVQCVTVEDSAEKIIDDKTAIINTIVKEIIIKNDVLNKKYISLDNWSSYDFSNDWIFGKEKDGKHYFIVVHPDGRFELYNKTDDFSSFNNELLNECSDYLTDNKGKEKIIIASSNGDINVITRTNRYLLPSEEIFKQDVLSRGKESRDKFLSGVVDINLYKDSTYYSVGIKGSGMNTKIIHAPHLYKVEVISGENIMEKVLSMLSATFVKYKSFTVLPYPIKYLNEYILMTERFNPLY